MLFQFPNASRKGALAAWPASFSFWNAGLSVSFSRIQIEIATSPDEAKNGSRQPQAWKASSPTTRRTT